MHKHKAIEGSAHGTGYGLPVNACKKQANGKACSNTGSHITLACKCGAIGVKCADYRRVYWTKQ